MSAPNLNVDNAEEVLAGIKDDDLIVVSLSMSGFTFDVFVGSEARGRVLSLVDKFKKS